MASKPTYGYWHLRGVSRLYKGNYQFWNLRTPWNKCSYCKFHRSRIPSSKPWFTSMLTTSTRHTPWPKVEWKNGEVKSSLWDWTFQMCVLQYNYILNIWVEFEKWAPNQNAKIALQLPYWKDKEGNLSESYAILKAVARKYGNGVLMPKSSAELAHAEMVEGVLRDVWFALIWRCFHDDVRQSN